MKIRWRRHGPALVALVLWVPTAAALGWTWLSGTGGHAAVPADDKREVMTVSTEEAAVISAVMRDNLRGYQAVLAAASQGDLEEAARLAEATADSPGPGRLSDSLDATLPGRWRQMGKAVHDGFRDAALAARQPDGATRLQAELAQVTARCLACHDSYRLVVSD